MADLFEVERDVSFPFDFRLIAKDTKVSNVRIDQIAFLTAGNYPGEDAAEGFERALDLFHAGEALGYDGAWIRQRHLERAVSSAATFRGGEPAHDPDRIGRGGHPDGIRESVPAGRGSRHRRRAVERAAQRRPARGADSRALLGERLFDTDPERVDSRMLAWPGCAAIWPATGSVTKTRSWNRLRARSGRAWLFAPGLTERLWYGAGSARSAEWAARNGFNLLIANVTTGEGTDNYLDAQLRQLALYRDHWHEAHAPRISLGRVIVPTDGASAKERERYRAFAEGRHARTLAPQGERRTLYAPDLVGPRTKSWSGCRPIRWSDRCGNCVSNCPTTCRSRTICRSSTMSSRVSHRHSAGVPPIGANKRRPERRRGCAPVGRAA